MVFEDDVEIFETVVAAERGHSLEKMVVWKTMGRGHEEVKKNTKKQVEPHSTESVRQHTLAYHLKVRITVQLVSPGFFKKVWPNISLFLFIFVLFKYNLTAKL